MPVTEATLPEDAFLQRYAQRDDCYTDCFSSTATGVVPLSQLISQFYQTPLFRAERIILKLTVRRPSTAADVAALANGTTKRFAAWDVEDRTTDQILLCDLHARTRSWLMCRPVGDLTRLYFGSAVTPPQPDAPLGFGFNALLGAHKVYSRLLLAGATKRLS